MTPEHPKHERRVVGHVSGWQEQMDTCVCGKPRPCPEAERSTPATPEHPKPEARTPETDLAKKMIARADADGLPSAHELRALAAAFDESALGFYAEPQTCDVRRFMGCWARARRAWRDYSGESQI